MGEVFNQDDDDESETKRRKLSLPPEEEREQPATKPVKLPTTAEEKKQYIKTLIESIPTSKEELFAFQLEWSMVDTVSGINTSARRENDFNRRQRWGEGKDRIGRREAEQEC